MVRQVPLPLLCAVAWTGCSSTAPCPKGSERWEDGLCHLVDDIVSADDSATPALPGTDSGQTDSAAPAAGYTFGDPILALGHYTGTHGPGEVIQFEWTDAAAINDDYAIVTGQGGYGIISMADGDLVHQENIRRTLRVGTDGTTAILASRLDGFIKVDVSAGGDTRGFADFRAPSFPGAHEDVDVDGEQVLIGWHDNGAILTDLDGTLLGVLPARDAFAVQLLGDRALVTDGAALVLFDISNPSEPVELDRQEMAAEGRDLSSAGGHVVVGMGGGGVGVWQLDGDALVHRTDLSLPGSAMSVAVDADRAWVGAWSVAALVDLAAEPPVVLGYETPHNSAMGVGASGGRAVLADWYHSTALQAVDGVAGPELLADRALFFSEDGPGRQVLEVENHGLFDLELSLAGIDRGYTVVPDTAVVEAGSGAFFTVEWTEAGRPSKGTLRWSTNDPDLPTATIELSPADQGVGTEHVDFSLPGFVLPSGEEGIYTLSESRGKAVVLVYWALF
jgi:hypothetical protein